MMKTLLLLLLVLLLSSSATAAEPKFSPKGADTCLQCHEQSKSFALLDIFSTAHGSLSEGKRGFKEAQCEGCHGPIGEHGKKRLRKGQQRQKMTDFRNGVFSVKQINQRCSSCHNANDIGHFKASVHDNNQLACTSCHNIHVKKDPVLTAQGQLSTCGSCHQVAKVNFKRFSHHPLGNDTMSCTDCHQPHDSNQNHLLRADSVNKSCTTCHGAKRGPFLWPHAPASEDCTLCHNPHGSNQPDLLKQRAPFLCQQCHGADGHSSFMPVTQAVGGLRPSVFVLGKSCVNCHSRVHGSNHPSGDKLQR